MSSWTSEEVVEGLELWLKTRRDEIISADRGWGTASRAIDQLLDEVRDSAVEGWLPWQRISKVFNSAEEMDEYLDTIPLKED